MSLSHDAQIVKLGPVTEDAFLRGRLSIAQPMKGFRAGLDSVLLGAAVGQGARHLLDLGAGAGTAGLVALAIHPALDATLVESDAEIATLAAATVASNNFAGRARIVPIDLTSSGRVRSAAGLKPE